MRTTARCLWLVFFLWGGSGTWAQDPGESAGETEQVEAPPGDELDELIERLSVQELSEYDIFRAPTRPIELEYIVPEWHRARYLILAAPSHVVMDPSIAETFCVLIREAITVTDVILLVDDSDLGNLRRLFHVLDDYDLSDYVRAEPPIEVEGKSTSHSIFTVPLPVDTHWTRDYGPLFGVTADQRLCLIDSAYRDVRKELSLLSLLVASRRNDDTVPTILSGLLPGRYLQSPIVSVRSPLQLWGGDFFTDGARTGFTSTETLIMNGAEAGWVNHLLRSYYGIDRVLYLEPLPGRTIKHIDMFFRVVNPKTFLLAQYDATLPASTRYYSYFHEMIHATLERNHRLLKSEFPDVKIIRVPIPPLIFSEDQRQMLDASLYSLGPVSLDPELWQFQSFTVHDRLTELPTFSEAARSMALDSQPGDSPGIASSPSQRMRDLVNTWLRNTGARFDPAADAQEAAVLDSELQRLRDWGTDSNSTDRILELQSRLDELRPNSTYFSYLNAIHLRGDSAAKVMVPGFSAYRRFESKVSDAYREAYPEAEIVFIPSDRLIEQWGALHCISCVIPDVDLAMPDQDPATSLLLSPEVRSPACPNQRPALDSSQEETPSIDGLPDPAEPVQGGVAAADSDPKASIELVTEFARAQRAIRSADFDTAEELLTGIIDSLPESPAPYLTRAICRRASGDHEQALDDCDSCLDLVPDSPHALLCKVGILAELYSREMALNSLDRADHCRNQAVEILSHLVDFGDRAVQPSVLFEYGTLLHIGGDYLGALDAFDAASEFDRNYRPVYPARAQCRLDSVDSLWTEEEQLERLKGAVDDFEVATASFPDRSEIWVGSARAKLKLADAVERALAVGEDEWALEDGEFLSDLYVSEYGEPAARRESASADLDEATWLNPFNWEAYLVRAEYSTQHGDFYSALNDYGTVINSTVDTPTRIAALRLRHALNTSQENTFAALEDLEAIVALDSSDLSTRLDLANGLANSYLSEHALKHYQTCVHDVDFNNYTAQVNMRFTMLEAGELERAFEEFHVTVVDYPDDRLPICGRGLAHICRGEWNEAIADFDLGMSKYVGQDQEPYGVDIAFCEAFVACSSGDSRQDEVVNLLNKARMEVESHSEAIEAWYHLLIELARGQNVERLWSLPDGERVLEKYLLLGAAAERDDQPTEALQHYRDALMIVNDGWFLKTLAISKCRGLARDTGIRESFGAHLERLRTGRAVELGVAVPSAAVVGHVAEGGIASRAGLQAGDVILSINEAAFDIRFTWTDLALAAEQGRLTLEIDRDGQPEVLEVSVDP